MFTQASDARRAGSRARRRRKPVDRVTTMAVAPDLTLAPAAHAEGVVPMPGSKSISNRVLLIAALAEGTTVVDGVLEADDTDRMLEALEALGVSFEHDPVARTCTVTGGDGRVPQALGAPRRSATRARRCGR